MHTGRKRVCYTLSVIGNDWRDCLDFGWLFLDVEVNNSSVFLNEKSGPIKFIVLHHLTRASTSIISHRPSGMEGSRFCLVAGSFFFPLCERAGVFLLSSSSPPSGASGAAGDSQAGALVTASRSRWLDLVPIGPAGF